MLQYINVIKGIGEHIATSSGVVAAFATVDSINATRFYLGMDVNNPPKLDEGPVFAILPAPSQVDAGEGVINLGQDYNEQNPGFKILYGFECSTTTTSNNLIRQDGYDFCDSIGQVIVTEVIDYFRAKGYEMSYIDYQILPSGNFPEFCGSIDFAIRGLRTLEADPTF